MFEELCGTLRKSVCLSVCLSLPLSLSLAETKNNRKYLLCGVVAFLLIVVVVGVLIWYFGKL